MMTRNRFFKPAAIAALAVLAGVAFLSGQTAPEKRTVAGIDFSVSLSTTPKSITFTPKKTGKYAFECTHKLLFFKSHKDQGMHGILEVVD